MLAAKCKPISIEHVSWSANREAVLASARISSLIIGRRDRIMRASSRLPAAIYADYLSGIKLHLKFEFFPSNIFEGSDYIKKKLQPVPAAFGMAFGFHVLAIGN